MIDNDMSVPEPDLVPMGSAGGGVAVAPGSAGICSSVLVEGNRIDGYSEGVMIAALTAAPGAGCSDITVRNNDIVASSWRVPADPRINTVPDPSYVGKLGVAAPIRVINLQRILAEGVPIRIQAQAPGSGWPAGFADARITGIVIEGNRITGAVGLGIEVVGVDDSRIRDNEIDVRPTASAEEMEAVKFGGNLGEGLWPIMGVADEIDGSPTWTAWVSDDVVVN